MTSPVSIMERDDSEADLSVLISPSPMSPASGDIPSASESTTPLAADIPQNERTSPVNELTDGVRRLFNNTDTSSFHLDLPEAEFGLLLGSGATCQVFKARVPFRVPSDAGNAKPTEASHEPPTPAKLVVKAINTTRESDRESDDIALRRGLLAFERELAALTALHEVQGVVRLRGSLGGARPRALRGRLNHLLFLDECRRGELFNVLNELGDGLPAPVGRTFLRQLFKTVAACHDRGVAHRDIKPEVTSKLLIFLLNL